MIEHIGEMPGTLWRELVDGEEDPFEIGDSDIEWHRRHHTLLRVDGRPVASVGWSWSMCRPAARPSPWRASAV